MLVNTYMFVQNKFLEVEQLGHMFFCTYHFDKDLTLHHCLPNAGYYHSFFYQIFVIFSYLQYTCDRTYWSFVFLLPRFIYLFMFFACAQIFDF